MQLLRLETRIARPLSVWLAVVIPVALALAACGQLTTPLQAPQAPPPSPAAQAAPPPETAPLPPLQSPPPEATPLPLPATATPLPPGGKVRVALLLPLSGAGSALGQAMLDAAMMAVYDVGADQIELLPHDTGASPEAAADAARAAVNDGARLVIGPLLAADVEAVKPVAQQANVPILAFSSTASLAGDGTYLLSFQPRPEITRVVAYARAKGVSRFAILAPHTPYGDLAVIAMQDAVTANQSTLDVVGDYDANPNSLADAAKRFAGKGSNYDALMLPDGGQRLKAMAALLAYYDIDPDKIHFLGTGLWDDQGLGAEPNLVNGWYAAPAPQARADFERRFQEAEGKAPPRLATLAYDATALAAVLAKNPAGPDFSATALTNPSGFVGLDGVFRLRPDGSIERQLAVLQVGRDRPRVLDPAPQSFAPPSE
jgi:branched-chain amino acid transport system substrate-binding protein